MVFFLLFYSTVWKNCYGLVLVLNTPHFPLLVSYRTRVGDETGKYNDRRRRTMMVRGCYEKRRLGRCEGNRGCWGDFRKDERRKRHKKISNVSPQKNIIVSVANIVKTAALFFYDDVR